MQSVHSQCTVSADSVHSQCTVSAQSVYSQCRFSVQSVHSQHQVYMPVFSCVYTGRIGSRQKLAGGVSWGCPAVLSLVGTIYTQFNSGVMENPYFEKLADFSLCACGHVVDWPHMAQVRFATKKAHLEKKIMPFGNSQSWDKKLRTFPKYRFSYFKFYASKGKRGCFGSKKRCFRVFWTECEGADPKQRQGITTMVHRNKIQSLVLPVYDPGDAPDCITEYGPLPVNMAIYAVNQPIFRTSGFPCKPSYI